MEGHYDNLHSIFVNLDITSECFDAAFEYVDDDDDGCRLQRRGDETKHNRSLNRYKLSPSVAAHPLAIDKLRWRAQEYANPPRESYANCGDMRAGRWKGEGGSGRGRSQTNKEL